LTQDALAAQVQRALQGGQLSREDLLAGKLKFN